MKASELVLASDGSLYHIHATGSQIADNVILVGDPQRVEMFKQIFDHQEYESVNREIHLLTGSYHGRRFTALSTGMGCDNIDIVMTEIDAAANIDLATGKVNSHHRTLNLVRIGTSGSLHHEIPCGAYVASRYTVGLDGLLNYYDCDPAIFESEMLNAFLQHLPLDEKFARPYAVAASQRLLDTVANGMHLGITATAPGFYAPQGREIRIAPSIKNLNEQLASFEWNGTRLTNLEMETSAIYGMAKMLGHNALTVCLIIANRADGTFLNEYHQQMRDLIATVLDRL